MTFDRVIEDGRLWAVHFCNEKKNALEKVMSQWSDAGWLADFFTQNFDDLITYFRITNIWTSRPMPIWTISSVHWRIAVPVRCCWEGKKFATS